MNEFWRQGSATTPAVTALVTAVLLTCGGLLAEETTVYTDGDARIVAVPNTQSGATNNYGGSFDLSINERYGSSSTHKFYLHFTLDDLPHPAWDITEARLQFDLNGTADDDRRDIYIFAIVDEAKDWELGDGTGGTLAEGTGTGSNTPENDINWGNAPQNRTNDVTFLEEGTATTSVTRRLGIVSQEEVAAGSGVDLDITEFIQWVFGQNPAYASGGFSQGDLKITILARHRDASYSGGLWTFYSKEGAAASGGAADAPRIVVTQPPPKGTVVSLR